MKNPNQKTGDDKPELEEMPEVNNNKDQENTKHMDTKDSGEKKTEGREIDEELVAAKWKSRMIVRYVTRTDRSLNTEDNRTTRRDEINDYG